MTDLGGPALISLYNLVASNLGQGAVRKFADLSKGRTRTWAKLVGWHSQPDDFSMSQEELDKQQGRKKSEPAVQLSDEDKQQIAQEAAARKPAEVPKSEQLLQAAAAARKTPTTGGRGNIWRRAKHENPSKVAYRPEAGTVQGELYALLTREGGILMEDYCEAAKQIKTKDATLFTPSSVWGALRYLFVTKRGYGLDFDGQKLQLLVPADERQSSRKLKREG